MRKETLGAALFFCGFGIMITLFCPLDGWFWRLIVSMVLMLLGMKVGDCY